MFEGNVLVKKYRGGRQEDYLKKGFALFWDYFFTFSKHECLSVYIHHHVFSFQATHVITFTTFIYFTSLSLTCRNYVT